MPAKQEPITRNEWRLAITPALGQFTAALQSDGKKSWMTLSVYDVGGPKTKKTVTTIKVCITTVHRDHQPDKMVIIKGHTKDRGNFNLVVFYRGDVSENNLLVTGMK